MTIRVPQEPERPRRLHRDFRLHLHTAGLNLLVRLRQALVPSGPTPAELESPADFPTEALDAPRRKRFFYRRRKHDPLGGGFASTWRTRRIKVAAEVIARARRVLIRRSGSWPYLEQYLQIRRAVNPPPPPLQSSSG